MATDLDALDEIFSEPAAKKVRTGVKFQPKAKPRPRKESSAVVDVGENKKPSLVGSGSETLKNEKSLKNNEDFVSGVHSSDDRAVVNPSLEHFVIGESLGSGAGLPSDVSPDVNGLHFTIGKSAGESADIFFGLESLDDFYSQSTTTSTVGAANRSLKEVDLSVHLGNDLSTSCPVNNDAEGILAHSEIPTVRDSDTRSVEEEPVIPVVSHLNVSAVGVSNASSPDPSADLTIPQDPLTCGDSASCESGVPHINTRCVEIEDAEANPCLETLFQLTTQSGQRRGKFKPKPKAQIDGEKPGGMTSRPQGYESVPCSQNAQYVPSESEYINEASIPAMPTNDLLNFSSLRFDDTSSQIPEIEEPMYPGETSEKIVSPRTKCRKRKRRKVPVVSSDHQQASISGPENEADDDENYVYESPSGSHIHEDESFDGKLQEIKTTKKRKVPRKSNKSATQKEKPVQKRKKAKEVPDPATKEPPGKFSHSTKRKRRQVDKALLDTPEDEIDVTKLCMRDLILLAEHRERISSKEGKTSEVPSTLHSAGTSYAGYNEDETFASEQGGLSDDQTIPIVQESSTYTNYQTYMNKTPRSRWSKQDTELFYKALRQFGSDISMIQQLFPGRSRTQVKLKYKKEERQNPLRLHEALTTRSKDHTHFQLVIEHLKEVAAQEKENSCRDDSTGFPGDEEEEEVAKSEQAEEGVKQAEEGEVEATEPDITEVHSPTKTCDTEDDLSRWSQYKSEL
ncbi:uncharacterized protein LOC131306664 [Rhododendron vialii]|uniref:uncharacterized protein LOC131306664 n=1 Tax=Rhododendron vialii TaxID=182163 RepID=UPI00265EF3C1|nr:uncharacterized protein LOC131306664 [Rhododendron vialii]